MRIQKTKIPFKCLNTQTFPPPIDPVDRETIQTALYTLGLMTCIDFVPYDGEVEDYLLIWPVEEPAG
jgi:hypothetical protein